MEPISLKSAPLVGRAALRLQSDDRLTRLCRDGVEPAFDEIVRRYWGPLVGFAGTIVGADKAEDVVQDSLMRAQSALAGDQREIALKPWLYKIVRNAALNDIRDNRKHDHAELDETYDGVERPEEAAERRAELDSTVAAISSLPEAQKRALVGRELEGRSHAEIAADLDVTEGATKQLIHRARVGVRAAVGALIPLGLIKALFGSTASANAAAAAGAGAAAAGSGAATGAGGAAAGAGGLLGAIGGAGAAKVAAVAVLVGGTAVAGVEVTRSGGGDSREAVIESSSKDSNGEAALENAEPITGSGKGNGPENAEGEAAPDASTELDGSPPGAANDNASADGAAAESGKGAHQSGQPNGNPGSGGGREGGGSGKGGGRPKGGGSASPGKSDDSRAVAQEPSRGSAAERP